MKRAETAALFLLAFLIPTTNAVAQANNESRKGSIEWRIIGGGALPVDVVSARPDRRLSFGAVEIGRILTTTHGPGIIAGQFELSLQMMPIVVRGPEDFWGVRTHACLRPLEFLWNESGTFFCRCVGRTDVGGLEHTGTGADSGELQRAGRIRRARWPRGRSRVSARLPVSAHLERRAGASESWSRHTPAVCRRVIREIEVRRAEPGDRTLQSEALGSSATGVALRLGSPR